MYYGQAKQGDGTAEDGRKTERSSAPYAEAYSPRFCEYLDLLDKFLNINVNIIIQIECVNKIYESGTSFYKKKTTPY